MSILAASITQSAFLSFPPAGRLFSRFADKACEAGKSAVYFGK